MPPTTSALIPWIDQALKANGHPPCARIVRSGRNRQPPVSWDKLAVEISAKAGGTVGGEMLRLNFGHLDPKPIVGGAA